VDRNSTVTGIVTAEGTSAPLPVEPFPQDGTGHGSSTASDGSATLEPHAGLPVDAQASHGEVGEQASVNTGGVHCGRCQTANAPGTWACSACGSFLPGNSVARTHGLRSQRQPADLTMTADEVERGLVADNGGADELSTLERRYVRHIRNVEITLGLLMNDIARHGLLTKGGRVRDVYAGFLNGLDRFDRLSQRLGMKRRSKRVPTLDEYLARRTDTDEADPA